MRRFVAEVYTPIDARVGDIADRARHAAEELSEDGIRVRYVEPIFIPEDETCFHLLDAETPGAARQAMERAGVSPQRITEAAR